MARWHYASMAALPLVLLSGCADRLVDVPTNRPPALAVRVAEPARCPPDTVLLSDDDPASGAGAIPAEFQGRTVLRCEVDNLTAQRRGEITVFTVRQTRTTLTPQLRAAFDLPNREFRPNGHACAAGLGGTTALYVVDGRDRAVRVRPPTDQPCQVIREEVWALLTAGASPAQTFQVSDRRA